MQNIRGIQKNHEARLINKALPIKKDPLQGSFFEGILSLYLGSSTRDSLVNFPLKSKRKSFAMFAQKNIIPPASSARGWRGFIF